MPRGGDEASDLEDLLLQIEDTSEEEVLCAALVRATEATEQSPSSTRRIMIATIEVEGIAFDAYLLLPEEDIDEVFLRERQGDADLAEVPPRGMDFHVSGWQPEENGAFRKKITPHKGKKILSIDYVPQAEDLADMTVFIRKDNNGELYYSERLFVGHFEELRKVIRRSLSR